MNIIEFMERIAHISLESGLGGKELCQMSRGLASYAFANDIANVGFIDRAARLAYLGFRELWKHDYPDAKMPGIYFFNPDGFGSRIPTKYLKQQFEEKFRYLVRDKNKPFLLFDTCIHEGKSSGDILKVLEAVGFENVHLTIASKWDDELPRGVEVNQFLGLNSECYPFGDSEGLGIKKTLNSEVSSVDLEGLPYGIQRRLSVLDRIRGRIC